MEVTDDLVPWLNRTFNCDLLVSLIWGVTKMSVTPKLRKCNIQYPGFVARRYPFVATLSLVTHTYSPAEIPIKSLSEIILNITVPCWLEKYFVDVHLIFMLWRRHFNMVKYQSHFCCLLMGKSKPEILNEMLVKWDKLRT